MVKFLYFLILYYQCNTSMFRVHTLFPGNAENQNYIYETFGLSVLNTVHASFRL